MDKYIIFRDYSDRNYILQILRSLDTLAHGDWVLYCTGTSTLGERGLAGLGAGARAAAARGAASDDHYLIKSTTIWNNLTRILKQIGRLNLSPGPASDQYEGISRTRAGAAAAAH